MKSASRAFKALPAIVLSLAFVFIGSAAAQNWTQLGPTGGPPIARMLHTAVYDQTNNRMIVFGGYKGYTFSGACANVGPVYTITSSMGTCIATVTWVADANYHGATRSQTTTVENVPPPVLTVRIDIKPGSFPNSINPRSQGVILVAILTTATVDPATVRFGRTGSEATPVQAALEDVDGDGDAA